MEHNLSNETVANLWIYFILIVIPHSSAAVGCAVATFDYFMCLHCVNSYPANPLHLLVYLSTFLIQYTPPEQCTVIHSSN